MVKYYRKLETGRVVGNHNRAMPMARDDADERRVTNLPRAQSRMFGLILLPDRPMQKPPLDPDVAAPMDAVLTAYDREHVVTYLRLLDADTDGADWQEVARVVLHLEPRREPDRA